MPSHDVEPEDSFTALMAGLPIHNLEESRYLSLPYKWDEKNMKDYFYLSLNEAGTITDSDASPPWHSALLILLHEDLTVPR